MSGTPNPRDVVRAMITADYRPVVDSIVIVKEKQAENDTVLLWSSRTRQACSGADSTVSVCTPTECGDPVAASWALCVPPSSVMCG